MTKLPCGCDEKEVIISNIKGTIDYYEKDIEWVGLFKTEIEAFNVYKQAKETFVKEQAEKWKGKIDDRAYKALMSYQVEITD